MNATAIRLREQTGLTQFEVAQKTGVHPSLISRLESGTGRPGTDGLLKLAHFYGASIEALLTDSNADEPSGNP